ncbi:MAG: hypothetical protein H3C38_14375 [Rhodospirillales bacterium]|nr:hypothetical protein [Rhodospirillales bacterium]
MTMAFAALVSAAPLAAAEAPVAGRFATLIDGLASSADRAAEALREQDARLEATKALDAAERVALVFDHAAPPPLAALAKQASGAMKHARQALQNGDPAKAAEVLAASAAALRAADPGVVTAPPKIDADDGPGKDVVNAEGHRIAEIDEVVRRQDGRSYAVLKTGGAIDWFGFIDFGNERVVVPLEELVAGKNMVVYAARVSQQELASQAAPPADGDGD